MANPAMKFLLTWWPWIVFAIALLQFLLVTNSFVYFKGGDNAVYINLARSLARGAGFVDIGSYPLIAHTKYPFFYPLMISAVFATIGENILAVKIIGAVCMAFSVLAGGLLFRDREDHLPGLFAVTIFTFIPFMLYYSTRISSDIPFACFVMATLLFAERALKQTSIKNAYAIIAALMLVIAYNTRSAGIALAPALLAAAMLRQPIKENLKNNLKMAALFFVPFFVAATAWQIRGRIATAGQGKNYIKEFLRTDPRNLDSPMVGVADLIERMGLGLDFYFNELGKTLNPFIESFGRESVWTFGLFLALIAAGGLVRAMMKRRGAVEFFAIFYTGLILVWNSRSPRFLVPLYPVLLYYAFMGVEGLFVLPGKIAAPLKGRALPSAAAIAAALLFLIDFVPNNFTSVKGHLDSDQEAGVALNPYFRVVATNRPMGKILHLGMWLRENSKPDEVSFARKAPLIALVSERPSVGGPFYPEPADFIKNLEDKNVSYIVCDDHYKEVDKYFMPAIRAYPHRFRLVYRIPNNEGSIYRFLAPDQIEEP